MDHFNGGTVSVSTAQLSRDAIQPSVSPPLLAHSHQSPRSRPKSPSVHSESYSSRSTTVTTVPTSSDATTSDGASMRSPSPFTTAVSTSPPPKVSVLLSSMSSMASAGAAGSNYTFETAPPQPSFISSPSSAAPVAPGPSSMSSSRLVAGVEGDVSNPPNKDYLLSNKPLPPVPSPGGRRKDPPAPMALLPTRSAVTSAKKSLGNSTFRAPLTPTFGLPYAEPPSPAPQAPLPPSPPSRSPRNSVSRSPLSPRQSLSAPGNGSGSQESLGNTNGSSRNGQYVSSLVGSSGGGGSTLPWANAMAAMSAEEQEREDIDALEQAEGSIVVDPDEAGSDAGYETDSVSDASTSLASSVRDYAFENGRRYHKFREGRYNFPNDDIEQEREDMKHAMMKMLCRHLYFAPIKSHPQEVLDVGTGTGIWAIEMGDQFPGASVLGIDLSPIQPDWVPPNVKFMVDDVESPWLHPRNHFDYIHSRHMVMAIRDWPRLFRRALEHLKPGGWIELQEIHHFPTCSDKSMTADHPVAQYWKMINDGLSALGVDFHAAAGERLSDMMKECGFTNVHKRIFHVPVGTWPKNKVLKTVGLYWRTILLDGIQAIALGPLTRGCKWSQEQVEVFLVDTRKGYMDNSVHMYMPLHVIYAQKPEDVGWY